MRFLRAAGLGKTIVIFGGWLQRDDGAGRSTGVTVGVPENEIFFKISEDS